MENEELLSEKKEDLVAVPGPVLSINDLLELNLNNKNIFSLIEKTNATELKGLYHNLLEGYRYRDELIPNQFKDFVHSFAILVTLQLGLEALGGNFSVSTQILYHVIILIVGIRVFYAILCDMQSNLSCKGQLRIVARRIEEKFKEAGEKVNYWQVIELRKKFWLERVLKGIKNKKIEKSIGDSMSYSSIILMFIWAITSFLMIGKLIF